MDAAKKFEFLQKYLPKNTKVLDFGCGTGDFIKVAKEQQYQCWGYDISKYAAQFVSKKYAVPVVTKKLSKSLFKPNTFDCIVMFDTIEHILDIDLLLNCLNLWLKKRLALDTLKVVRE